MAALVSSQPTHPTHSTHRPRALIHLGKGDCEGCPETVGKLLSSSPYNFEVHFAGPKQAYKVNATTLSQFQIYAQGGGPDAETSWSELRTYKHDVQQFLSKGGIYMGFCLGAYLAGKDYYDIVPKGSTVESEIESHNAEVTIADLDTLIHVDWTFLDKKSIKRRSTFFQEGAVMRVPAKYAIGRYSKNQDIAASITPYGKGRVALVGFHPEADQSWCEC